MRYSRLAVASLGGALLMVTGCAPFQAGAAAIVDQERLSHDQVRTQVAELRAQAEAMGLPLSAQQRAELSTDVVSQWVYWRLVSDAAAEEGVRPAEADGREETLDGLLEALTTPQVEDEVAELEEQVREDFLAQGEAAGLAGEELEEQVDRALEDQAEQLRGQVLRPVLEERIAEQMADSQIEVSRRYGTFDEELPGIVPGSSPLSDLGGLDSTRPDGSY